MRISDNNFFNLFKRLAANTNKDCDCDEWTVASVRWRRQRHIVWSTASHQVEVHELQHVIRPRWQLLVVHEVWWARSRQRAIRNAHWAHLESGRSQDVLKWFAERQEELD